MKTVSIESTLHWNNFWKNFKPYDIKTYEFPKYLKPFIEELNSIDVKNKDVLDLGCGNGALSAYLASKGAKVTAIDISDQSLFNTKQLALYNNVDVTVKKVEALEIKQLNKKFDLVVGKFILHHIEPFSMFVNILYDIMKENSKGIFFENNSRNKLLMFFRHNLVGKFGVPKYGDDQEYPFEPKEIEDLKQKFFVSVSYSEFKCFSMLAQYLFKNNKISKMIFTNLDKLLYNFKFLQKYSYDQQLILTKTNKVG